MQKSVEQLQWEIDDLEKQIQMAYASTGGLQLTEIIDGLYDQIDECWNAMNQQIADERGTGWTDLTY